MNRFRKYKLLKEFNGVRLTHKAIPDRNVGYVMVEAGITSDKAANVCYYGETHRRESDDIVVFQIKEFNLDDLKDAKFIHPKDLTVDYENSK